MPIHLSCFYFKNCRRRSNQGSTAIHHSSTTAKLKNPFRKRAVSFSEVFFGYFLDKQKVTKNQSQEKCKRLNPDNGSRKTQQSYIRKRSSLIIKEKANMSL